MVHGVKSRDPFDEGKLAATNNEEADANPYEKDSPEFTLWMEGFEFVCKYDEDGQIPSDFPP
jgi:hypothetical protein